MSLALKSHRSSPCPGSTSKRRSVVGALAGLLLAASLTGCSPLQHGFLAPAGLAASGERDLLLWIVGLALVVVLPVILLTPLIVWRYRHGNDRAAYRPRWEFSWLLDVFAWGVPALIVAVLAVLVWTRTHSLDPYRSPTPGVTPLEIQVIGLDWKWLFLYPEQGIATVNELVLPAGRPVQLRLTSDTVMQSLLLPRLGGQIYAMAGMQTQRYLQIPAPGQFEGRNAQYSGEGFQDQHFPIRVLAEADFQAWTRQVGQAREALDCAHYQVLARPGTLEQAAQLRLTQTALFAWVLARYRQDPVPTCATFQGATHD
ncbi:cytochrome o ubiquinol oxidase subunit 2 [Pseudomonas sp. SORGH_AS 211]|uniref:ubiquinol oxidase subunit II n=1 Tax=Pseudomonas sp. SORGH_AS_0211 TaxID=3041796 RepID=UPI00285CDD86|nr:ubiquinol oxidase subunit II [Pseudomonas sp. SORGH_AS_0211]MDR6178609.1 cytochrome o ubiquinol oxidase subunit 2 [Pseudomonas sp. SORGH_AS_0211]